MKIQIYLLLFFSLFSNYFTEEENSKLAEKLNSLKTDSKNFQYHILDSFEIDSVWEIAYKHTYLTDLKLVKKISNSKNFQLETKLFQEKTPEHSLQIHANIEIPGRDKIIIKPVEPKFFPAGRPSLLSIWVHSSNKELNLKIVLSQKRGKDIEIGFGKLDFHGWKRMEAKIPILKKEERLEYSKREEYAIKYILLESTAKMPKTDFVIYLDLLSTVIQKYKEYPGSEIPDGWYLD